MELKEAYIFFYTLLFVLAITFAGIIIYNVHIKEPLYEKVTFDQKLNINVKDSRFHYDREGGRTFSKKNIVLPTMYDVFDSNDKKISSFLDIQPPYILVKNQNSDTIQIFRQFFGDTLYIKIDTIDHNELFIKDLKKILQSRFRL